MKTTILLPLVLLLAVLSLANAAEPAPAIEQTPAIQPAEPAPTQPAPDPALVAKVTASALAGDWKQVLELTEGVDLANPSPVLKLVRGHACLALNHNNEATLLFFGTRDPQQLQAYEAWAGENLAKNTDYPYARFFAGDAAARLGKWDEAVREFDAAIQQNQEFALAYNARGVVQAAQSNTDRAKQDFRKAAALTKNRLADANSNIGYLWIQLKDSAQGAKEAFIRAIDASPAFALAQHGRGCIALIQRDPKAAAADFAVGDENGIMFVGLMAENEVRYAALGAGVAAEDLIAELQEPGMSLRMTQTNNPSIDKLRQSAENDFKLAQHIESMNFLPFNKRFASAIDGAGARKLGRLENDFGPSATDGIKGKERGYQYADKWMKEDSQRNSPDGKIRQTQMKFATDIAVNFGEKMLGSKNVPSAMAGAIFKATKDNIVPLASGVHETWKDYDRMTFGRMAQRASEMLPTSAANRTAPQGVDLTMNIDNGNWPFIPIYSLAYPRPVNEPRQRDYR